MKMSAQLFDVLFTAGVFLFALLVCLINIQWRRRKYREIADEMGAQYQSQGFSKTGEIVGCDDRRKYKIETKAFGRSGGMWTIASLDCANRGIGFSIHGGFFKSFPEWRFIFMRGDNRGVSGVHLTLLNAGHPLEERYWPQVQGLFQEIAMGGGNILKKGDLKIEQDTISFTQRGVLTKVEGIRQIVSQLTEVARRIEAAPVL